MEDESVISVSPSLRMMKPPLRKRDTSKDEKKGELNKSTSGIELKVTPPEVPKADFLSVSK